MCAIRVASSIPLAPYDLIGLSVRKEIGGPEYDIVCHFVFGSCGGRPVLSREETDVLVIHVVPMATKQF